MCGIYSKCSLISSLIYPLTTRVVGAPQMISQLVFISNFPCSPQPSRTCRTPGLPMMSTGVNTASLGVYLHSTKARARRAEGFHDELNGHVFDLEKNGLCQFVLCLLLFSSISLHCSLIQFSLAFFTHLLMLLFISLYFSDPSPLQL